MARREQDPRPARPTYALRLGDDERALIAAAAAARGIPTSQYMREASISAARAVLALR